MDHPIRTKQTSREQWSKWLTLTRLRLSCAVHALFDLNKEETDIRIQNDLLTELNRALGTLRASRTAFSQATDPDLIEALIFEMKSAEARYNFLLKKAKDTGLSQPRTAR